MQLEPRTTFTIVRQLADPNDPGLYYVRATIRNARTDAIIDTVPLTDRGDRRFSANWETPVDTSGLGFYISILTEVFTDSDFTTHNSTYSDEMETYLVKETRVSVGGGSGGVSVDYKKIQKIVTEAIATIPQANLDNKPVLSAIKQATDKICQDIYEIEMPECDISPISAKIDSHGAQILKAVQGIKMPEMPDLSPILEGLSNADATTMRDNLEKVVESMSIISDAMRVMNALAEKMPGHHEAMDKLTENIHKALLPMVTGRLKVEAPEETKGPDDNFLRTASKFRKNKP